LPDRQRFFAKNSLNFARLAGKGNLKIPLRTAVVAGTIAFNSCWIRGGGTQRVRKLIAFDDDTFDKLKQLGRDRMATIQELADEAFADLLRKHGIPVDLKDALRKSASLSKASVKKNTKSSHQGKRK
jgi:hypothetical protein